MKSPSSFGKHTTEIGTYIYRLIDPRNGHTFYVGKGRHDRVFAHAKNQLKETEKSEEDRENEDYMNEKTKRITEIISSQLNVQYVIHRHSIETVAREVINECKIHKDGETLLRSISDKIAYEVEAALIEAYEDLSNITGGHNSSDRGCQHAEQLIHKYKKEALNPRHNLIALSIGSSYKDSNDLEKSVRLAWRANLDKAKQQDFVIAHSRGLVLEVFQVSKDDWLEATPENFPGEIKPDEDEDRKKLFPRRIGIRKGRLMRAPEEIRNLYKKHVLPPSRTTNPVRYFSPNEATGSITFSSKNT